MKCSPGGFVVRVLLFQRVLRGADVAVEADEFLEADAVFRDVLRGLRPDVAVVYRVKAVPGDVFLPFGIAEDEAVLPCVRGKPFLHGALVSLLHPLCAGSRGSTACPEHLLGCFGNFIYEMDRVSV